jgi:DeoR family transcriptional regulator, aga operon transcriptional repressor
MLASERKQKILELINEKEIVQISELTKLFDVAEMTIRRDLDDLDKENIIARVRGGAMKVSGPSIHRSAFTERKDEYFTEKKRIGKIAAELIGEKDTVLFDSGTTTMEIAKNLSHTHELFTMTMSIPIAIELSKYKQNQVYIPGGFLKDPNELNIIGNSTINALEDFSINKLFLGAWGFHEERGLVFLNVEETILRKKMMKIANEVNVVIDSSKFGKDGLVSINDFSKIDRIITDDKIPEDFLDFCLAKNIEVYVVGENDFKVF